MTAREITVMTRGAQVAEPFQEHFGPPPAQRDEEIVMRLRLRAGREESWHEALLYAIGQWSRPNEHVHGRHWHYVIGGEALDWLTLAQRLCLEIPDAMPSRELEALLFHGQLPERVGPERFRRMVGAYRYSALLNFHYGVTVEEALQLLTEDAIRKNRLACCYQDSDDLVEEAHRHLYGDSRATLALKFFDETGGLWGNDLESFTLPAWHEFTYWLFKRRIRKWHPARIASDARRGLECLRELQSGAAECPANLATLDEDALEEVPYSPYTRR